VVECPSDGVLCGLAVVSLSVSGMAQDEGKGGQLLTGWPEQYGAPGGNKSRTLDLLRLVDLLTKGRSSAARALSTTGPDTDYDTPIPPANHTIIR
jgi:hypothetical protein